MQVSNIIKAFLGEVRVNSSFVYEFPFVVSYTTLLVLMLNKSTHNCQKCRP